MNRSRIASGILPAGDPSSILVVRALSADHDAVQNVPLIAAWYRQLEARGMDVIHLVGTPEIGQRTSESDTTSSHEQAWIAAGELYERVRSLPLTRGLHHIFYLDPWAVMLDSLLKERFPDTQRWWLRQHEGEGSGHAEYWADMIPWMQQQGLSGVIEGTELLGMMNTPLPTSPTLSPDSDSGWPLQAMILVEDARDTPSFDVVTSLLRDQPSRPILFLTWHFQHLPSQCPDALSQCTVVLPHDEIADGTYRYLLSQAGDYVPPQSSVYDRQSFAALPPSCRVHLSETLMPRFQEDYTNPCSPIAALLHDGLERSTTSAPPQRSQRPTDPMVPQTSILDHLATWWRQLEPLIDDRHLTARTVETTETVPAVPTLPSIALLTCCHKYLQRFRIFINSVVRQTYPLEQLEVCVAVQGNPDGLSEYVELMRNVHPRLRIQIIDTSGPASGNKGKQINAAFRASTSSIIMVTDCDLVLPTTFVADMIHDFRPDHVLGCWRTPLSAITTARILTGNIDPVDDFDVLQHQWDDDEYRQGVRQGLLGYCQIVSRRGFETVGYPEEFEGYNQSDIVFMERLWDTLHIAGDFKKDRYVLHLSHLRDWTGTKVFL